MESLVGYGQIASLALMCSSALENVDWVLGDWPSDCNAGEAGMSTTVLQDEDVDVTSNPREGRLSRNGSTVEDVPCYRQQSSLQKSYLIFRSESIIEMLKLDDLQVILALISMLSRRDA